MISRIILIPFANRYLGQFWSPTTIPARCLPKNACAWEAPRPIGLPMMWLLTSALTTLGESGLSKALSGSEVSIQFCISSVNLSARIRNTMLRRTREPRPLLTMKTPSRQWNLSWLTSPLWKAICRSARIIGTIL